MINQCDGSPAGALDAIVALNTPPGLGRLTFSPSKFINACGKTRVCATAIDPDGDPIEFDWTLVEGCSIGVSVVSHEQQGNDITECVDLLPVGVGSATLDVKAYDLLHDQGRGAVRFETWLREHGYPNTSHASLEFPVYVGH